MSEEVKVERAELQRWLEAWREATQSVLSQASGQASTFALVANSLSPAESDLLYTITVSGTAQGEMAARLPAASALRLARKFLGETVPPPADSQNGAPSPLTNDDREAVDELLRQIAGLVATAVAPIVGGPIQLQVGRAEAAWTWSSDVVAALQTRDEAGAEVSVEMRLSPALAASLAKRQRAPLSQAEAAPQVSSSDMPDVSTVLASGYQRLLDVGLGVKLRFGTRRMLLRDVLALGSGVVVELDNALQSPVDLMLDGRSIARGEVVVIDGQYGLRVTEVLNAPNAVSSKVSPEPAS